MSNKPHSWAFNWPSTPQTHQLSAPESRDSGNRRVSHVAAPRPRFPDQWKKQNNRQGRGSINEGCQRRRKQAALTRHRRRVCHSETLESSIKIDLDGRYGRLKWYSLFIPIWFYNQTRRRCCLASLPPEPAVNLSVMTRWRCHVIVGERWAH